MTRRASPEEYAEADPLFSLPKARTTDPGTSHAAARSMASTAETQRRALLEALAGAPDGLTCDEADARLGWRVTSAGRRMPELVDLGLARPSGRTRPTRSGRGAIVYEPTEKGRGLVVQSGPESGVTSAPDSPGFLRAP